MPTRLTSHEVLNTSGRKVWREDGPTQGRCLWEMHGVWGWDTNKKEGVVLRENYFVKDPMSNKKVRRNTDIVFRKRLTDAWGAPRSIGTPISTSLSLRSGLHSQGICQAKISWCL